MSPGFPITFRPSNNIFSGLMVGNSLKHSQKGLFCILKREVSACLYAEKSGFKMHVLLYAHVFKESREWLEAKPCS